ncbi:hypothetical protein KVT40_006464 [Elsinoe batatas]|uniref:alpha-galactosidase n=1 Tax=Elsinoe batatas TaxID=2601811 RepID=A0A8K0L5C8_9PEZI|nr:hypothetical protein KVT40_006464 [Elsinoe batatas]
MKFSSLVLLAGVAAAAPVKKVWLPAVSTSWQIVLNQAVTADKAVSFDAQVYDLDLFETTKATIDDLHNKGKKVMCYFSAGSYEPYRPDSKQFQPGDMGSVMDGWEDEKWLQINSANVRKIMNARIALAAQKGCDAIDPDNVDGYSNDNGINLKKADAVNYINWMSNQATKRGMSIGLKNAGEIIKQVMPNVHFSVNEQCHEYDECQTFGAFIKAGKPVFNIEYPDEVQGKSRMATSDSNDKCNSAQTKSAGFSTVLKNMDLGMPIKECPPSPNYSRNPAPSFSA